LCFGGGNSLTEILISSLSQSLSSILSSIKKLGFAPSYGDTSMTLPINSRPELVGFINNLGNYIPVGTNSFPACSRCEKQS
jgi:hypothetical protein